MEATGDSDGFKHIPVRLYNKDQPMPQKLVKAFATVHSSENQSPVKRPMTLYDLIEDYFPNKAAKGSCRHVSLSFLPRVSDETRMGA